jgi:molecular chaperone DnaK (HSP70)
VDYDSFVSESRLIVGIDLGTTHTVVAWAPHPRSSQGRVAAEVFAVPQLVASAEVAPRPLLPSFLYAPPAGEAVDPAWRDGAWVIGAHARSRGQEMPGRLVSSAKSWLCHAAVDRTAAILPWGADVPEEVPRLSPVEASARLLRHVQATWDAAHPEAPLSRQQLILTVPASFDQAARELTLRAAADANLTVRLLEEPQAAFYDLLTRLGTDGLAALVDATGEATVLVCDVGGGTTDLTLIRVSRRDEGLEVTRVAVGRHLLLGGDNMDLALAHACEGRLVAAPQTLDPRQFTQLTLACHVAKERLLGEAPPDDLPVSVAGRGATLFGNARSTRLTREETERIVLDGFFPPASRAERPRRSRTGLVAFGLPYEQDPAITRHVASFFARHQPQGEGPSALLLNGGVFRAAKVAARLVEVVQSWGTTPVQVLPAANPDLAVARGAVAYGMALAGDGLTIGGGAPHGYYVGLDAESGRRALCVVPRGAKEGERHLATRHPLALRVGHAVRFDLFATDDATVDPPGAVVALDEERFMPLPPVTTTFDDEAGGEVRVHLEGELSAIGTLDLACVEDAGERRFRLAFDLRSPTESLRSRPSQRPGPKIGGSRLGEARELIERTFGKGRKDVKPREVKDLVRNLERVLGERADWNTELARSLFDCLAQQHRSRRRSPDHERVFWMLTGFCLRPGFGHPEDGRRIKAMAPLFREGLTFTGEARGWQQFFIAWRRMAGGIAEPLQIQIRDRLDPFLAPEEAKLKKPKGFRPMGPDELLELASWLERVPIPRRVELGRWLLERTWTSRDPRLWAALGRVGARTPAYASVHHVVPPNVVERWLDHLLREKWKEVTSAARTAAQLARVTGDRSRDVSAEVRAAVERELVKVEAPSEWARGVREFVPVEETERALLFGEDLPVGLRLLDDE